MAECKVALKVPATLSATFNLLSYCHALIMVSLTNSKQTGELCLI